MSNKAAAELFVTVRAVESTPTKVYAKLGVRSRTQLAWPAAGSALDPARRHCLWISVYGARAAGLACGTCVTWRSSISPSAGSSSGA